MNDHREWATDQQDFWRTASAFPEGNLGGKGPPGSAAEAPTSASHSDSGSRSASPTLGVDCLLIGPVGCGKTSFVASLEQACLAERGEEQLRLSWPRSLGSEIDETASAIISNAAFPPEVATKPRTYVCDVSRSRARGVDICNLRIRDEPGFSLLSVNGKRRQPTVAWPHRRPGRRRCLAIFVDPLFPAAMRWRVELSLALRQLQPSERLDTILVLLSKIDIFCDRLARHASAIERMSGHHSTPLDLARRIDPWRQAIELLGAATVELLRTSLSSPCDLAFGLISAAGFDQESGRPLGRDEQTLSDVGIGKHWSPFGVRDALRFIAFGEQAGHLSAPEAVDPIHSRWHSLPLR